MQLDSLSWFPGHMTKTRRMITAELGNVDAVCEILDARIPMSSRNPDVDELTAGKSRLIVLNRVDQADPEMTKKVGGVFPLARLRRHRNGREAGRGREAVFFRRAHAAAR